MNQEHYTGMNRLLKSEAVQMLMDKLYDGTFSEFLDDWKWIFSFSGKYKGVIVFYTLLGLFSSTLSLGAAYVSRILINIIVEKQYQNLWILIFAMLFSTIFSLAFGSIMGRISLKISIAVNNDIQGRIFDQIIDAEWSELNKYPGGDLLNRFNSDVGTISGNAIGWIPGIVINIYTFIITFIVMVRLDSVMAVIAFASAPVLLLMSRFIMRKLREYRKKVLEMNSQMMSFEVETFNHFDEIKSFGVIGYYAKELRKWQEKYKEFNLDYNKFEIKANIIMSLLSTAVSMLAFFYCLFRLWAGQILYGDMTFFLQQRSALSGNFNSLVKTIPSMMNSAVSAHRVRELVELKKEAHDPESLERLKKIAHNGVTVSMEDASFGYRESAEIYCHGNFTARPGEIVAVLGPSGEGKTTLLRMLLGLIHPEEGRVTITGSDGEPVLINADLRKLFSYVPQSNSVLSGSIADNMRIVKEDATDEEIITALKTACAWEFVQNLPDGINSKLGDSGKGISGGQAQRIAIARAILRDAPVLMLDEATSALDLEMEERVLQSIIRQNPNKTCIVCTHRTSVLKQCQRIYRIEAQSIIELDTKNLSPIMEKEQRKV